MRALRRQLTVAGVRVWLAGMPTDARRTRAALATWQTGRDWPSISAVERADLGRFSQFKSEAEEDNARSRDAGNHPLDDALAHADTIRAKLRRLTGPTDAVAAVPFPEALRAVLAGPHA